MKIIYSDETISPAAKDEKSIFLAGPTPRQAAVLSWRPEALAILRTVAYNGIVFVPEHQVRESAYDYLTQVEWEYLALEMATVVCFWVPRHLETLPGFTTNVEFGRYAAGCVYGRPPTAPRCRYLDWLYNKLTQKQPCSTLAETMKAAADQAVAAGSLYEGGSSL